METKVCRERTTKVKLIKFYTLWPFPLGHFSLSHPGWSWWEQTVHGRPWTADWFLAGNHKPQHQSACVCRHHFFKLQVSYFMPACSSLCCSCRPSTAWWKSNTAEEVEGTHTHTLSHTSEKSGLHMLTFCLPTLKSRAGLRGPYRYVLCLRWSASSPSLWGLGTQMYFRR